jgi:hypothetical protein
LLFIAGSSSYIAWRARHVDEQTRAWIVRDLSRRFDSEVELGSIHLSAFPQLAAIGTNLTIRPHSHMDLPPLIQIQTFTFNLGFLGVFHAPRHIRDVSVSNMTITIPPRGDKAQVWVENNKPVEPRHAKALPATVLDEVHCDNAHLVTLPRKSPPGKPEKHPLDWEIHDLQLKSVGAGRVVSFVGKLTNAKPVGEIITDGDFGPWEVDEPGSTPLSGEYQFTNADLGPFPGIAGILSSTGKFSGVLDELQVAGETNTPDFSLDNVGKPVPLHTIYSATVDGTNGDTLLHPVRATLLHSVLIANGSILGVPKNQGHAIKLLVTSQNARIEDVLRLAVKSNPPLLTGALQINAQLELPPSKQHVIDKIILDGDFSVSEARWSSTSLRDKLQSLSRHAQGAPADATTGSAISDLNGRFHLEKGIIAFQRLTFSIPGAMVLLAGRYKLRSGELDFHGGLRMQAKLSQIVTGKKAFFLKAVDPLFSKHGGGTYVPITITGTRENPSFAVNVFGKTIKK